jgi:hypothetical protein
MRREIHWETERDDGTSYEVRISFFGGKFKFQYKEDSADQWDYDRDPSREDLEQLLDIIKRRYQRRQAGPKEYEEAERLLKKHS